MPPSLGPPWTGSTSATLPPWSTAPLSGRLQRRQWGLGTGLVAIYLAVYYVESERSIYAGQEERAAGDDTGMKTEENVDDALVVDHAA